MAKIKMAGKKSSGPAGPKNPAALGCLIIIGIIILIVGYLLFISIAQK